MQPNVIVTAQPASGLQVAYAYAENANPVVTYLSNLKSENSRRVMRHSLRRVITLRQGVTLADLPFQAEFHFAWHELRYQDFAMIRALLIQQFAPATVNRHLSVVRGVVKECWRLGYVDAETYRRTVDIPNLEYEIIPAGRDITDRELRLMLVQCYEDKLLGVRDLALMALMATTGMRRTEVSSLNLADFTADGGRINVLYGKGGKQRTVYAQNRTLELLNAWIVVRGEADGSLFTSFRRGDHVTMNRLPASSIYSMIVNRASRAGLKKITPHDFRRKFVGDMLERNIDMVMIAKLTGHSDARMLARYDRRSEELKQQAAAKLDLPI